MKYVISINFTGLPKDPNKITGRERVPVKIFQLYDEHHTIVEPGVARSIVRRGPTYSTHVTLKGLLSRVSIPVTTKKGEVKLKGIDELGEDEYEVCNFKRNAQDNTILSRKTL